MKKFLAGLLGLLMSAVVCTAFVGCADDAESTEETKSADSSAKDSELEKLKEIYHRLLGTYKLSFLSEGDYSPFNTIIFLEDSVLLDTTKYDINQDTDLKKTAHDLCILINSVEYNIDLDKKDGSEISIISSAFGNSWRWFSKVTTSETDTSSSLAGTYKFTTATGTQTNGSISLSDGTWTYSGSKTTAAATSGTYTVDGSKVTVKWTASGTEVSETFTVTTTDSSSTWKSDNAYTSVFLSMLFGVSATEITFTYSE